jgi:hypothetical protein
MIATVLFSAHPPAPLSEEELEAEQRQAAAIKAQAVSWPLASMAVSQARPTHISTRLMHMMLPIPQAAQRKRKKEAAAASGAAAAPAPAPRPPAAAAAAVAAAAAQAAAFVSAEAGEAEAAGVKRGRKKAGKEYVPQLHSANYAFLLCLFQVSSAGCSAPLGVAVQYKRCITVLASGAGWAFRRWAATAAAAAAVACPPPHPRHHLSVSSAKYLQAQKGPAKKQHLSKAELMDLAEASGLSHKPIRGDGEHSSGACAALHRVQQVGAPAYWGLGRSGWLITLHVSGLAPNHSACLPPAAGTTTRQMPDGRTIAYDGWSNFKTVGGWGLAPLLCHPHCACCRCALSCHAALPCKRVGRCKRGTAAHCLCFPLPIAARGGCRTHSCHARPPSPSRPATATALSSKVPSPLRLPSC